MSNAIDKDKLIKIFKDFELNPTQYATVYNEIKSQVNNGNLDLINKETNHKTLEELGWTFNYEDSTEKIMIWDDYPYYFLSIDIDNVEVTCDKPMTIELLKAIELKMIELGVVNNEV